MTVVKFPFARARGAWSRMPRRSKNGTPEERAARAAADIAKMPLASVVDLSGIEARSREDVDRRKLRGSPLRDKVSLISFAMTITGKMHTADLREEPLDLEAARQEGWLQTLQEGAAAARFVADGLDKAAERLVMTPEEFKEAYDQAPPEIQQFISDKVRAMIAAQPKSETSDFPVNLPAPELGQAVLNLATEHDQ